MLAILAFVYLMHMWTFHVIYTFDFVLLPFSSSVSHLILLGNSFPVQGSRLYQVVSKICFNVYVVLQCACCDRF